MKYTYRKLRTIFYLTYKLISNLNYYQIIWLIDLLSKYILNPITENHSYTALYT